MPGFAGIIPNIGSPPINVYGVSDTQLYQMGFMHQAIDNYWGPGEFIYCRANGAINVFDMVVITPVVLGGQIAYNVTQVPNTQNLGRPVGIAMSAATSGQFLWVGLSGVLPVRVTASVAADNTFGITGVGQVGANSAGRQIVNARSVQPSTATVIKSATGVSGSNIIRISGPEGWFTGAVLSGTGIAGGATITSIDPAGLFVTLSANNTAAVNGPVTATYTGFITAHFNRPFAQGAIT